MTLDEFEAALDQLGVDLETWPQDVAIAARQLLGRSPAARQALDLAQRLDQGLAVLLRAPVKAPAGLADRIVARATQAQDDRVVPFPVRSTAPAAEPAPSERRRTVHPDRPAMIAAAMLVTCFIGGVVTVQALSLHAASTESVYISAIFSDLAR